MYLNLNWGKRNLITFYKSYKKKNIIIINIIINKFLNFKNTLNFYTKWDEKNSKSHMEKFKFGFYKL